MRVPDPFAPLANGPLHRLDIAIAERVTGVRRRSISRHMVEPAVRAGVRPANAVAVLHWGLLATGGLLVVGALSAVSARKGRA